MAEATLTRQKTSPLPVIGLFLLSPLVAEFLLGNLPIRMLGVALVLAPLYGGGALLIRELVRRAGRGWPSIVLLALAYGIVEEAFTTQSLFNPNYLKLNLHLLQPAYIPALGMGAWWTIFVLTLHTAWSISTSIALVEAMVPERAATPWLGLPGLAITALLFGFGCVVTTRFQLHNDPFVASHAQLGIAALICVGLVALAFLLPRRTAATGTGWIPKPLLAGFLALAAGSAVLLTPQVWAWGAFAAILVVDLGMAGAIWLWSRQAGWDLRHKLALAGGAALAYGWHAFVENPVIGGAGISMVRIGNAVFALGVIALIFLAARRTHIEVGERGAEITSCHVT